MRSLLKYYFLILSLFSIVSPLQAEEFATVSVQITKEELKYTKPCTWSVFEQATYGLPKSFSEEIKVEETENVPKGNYLATVSCPSTEGTLRQTKAFKVEEFQTRVDLSFRMVPSFLLVEVSRDEKQLSSAVWVYDQWGMRIANGIDHAIIVVPAEKIWVYARPDNEGEAQRPNEAAIGVKASGQLVMRPNQKSVLSLDVTPAFLKVKLKNNGRKAKGVITLLTRGGKPVLDWESASEVEVPPGSYQIKTQLDNSHDFRPKILRNIKILPGKKKSVVIDHPTGSVRATAVLNGKRVKPGHPHYDDIEIALHRAGVPTGFNSVASGERATLSPGTYDLIAQMKEKTLDDGMPWQYVKTVDVDSRGDYSFSLDLTPSLLVLETVLGEEGSAVLVSLLRLDDDIKVIESHTDHRGKAVFSLTPGGYRLQANPNPSNPELIQEQLIDVKKGQQLDVRMEIPLGKVMVQVFNEEGVALWCDVGLFRDGASKPLWTFKGGEEIWVPTGAYEVQVRYKSGRHSFGTIRVGAGRTAERKVIWP
mgnify:CR=1 FL=1